MDSNLRQRIVTGVILLVLFLGFLLYSPGTAQAMFIIIMLAMIYEFNAVSLAGVTSAFTYVFTAILGSIAMVILFVYRWSDESYLLIINYIAIAYVTINAIMLLSKKETLLPKIPLIQTFLYITLPILVLLYWIKESENSQWILFAIFAMIWISDIAAYFVGKTFGKHKLFPIVSPKKTWEGFFGGGLFTLIASVVVSFLLPDISLRHWLIIAAIIWLVGSLGDLVESSFKRHYKIKDSGTLLPGHGGVLDRLDSFIYSIPVVLLYIKLVANAS